MESVWLNVLNVLRERTNEQNFNLWFRPIKLAKVEDSTWTLIVPNRFLKDWISDNYLDILERSIYEVAHEAVSISIEVLADSSDRSTESEYRPTPTQKKKRRRKKNRPVLGMELNERFIFKSFVVGSSNEFAHAASNAVSKKPGSSYNPLFIYGGTGLGKTHLLQAIGHQLLARNKNTRVAYLTSERFMNELITSIATSQMPEFRRRYRDNCDILLMDDIQFIAGKHSTQEEFFHTFNFLFDSGKQIVVTSDQYPQEIKTLDERIRSRLQSGLVADIRPPSLETRAAILKKKAELDGFDLNDDVTELLAKYVKSNVRELEGSLIRLEAFASLTGAEINLNTAKEVLKNFLHKAPPQVTCEQIQRRVCRYYSISLKEMNSKSRTRKLVVPRQIAMYLVKNNTNLSLSEIGMRFGGKDHSTVIASVNKVEKMRAENMNIRDSINSLEKQLEI